MLVFLHWQFKSSFEWEELCHSSTLFRLVNFES